MIRPTIALYGIQDRNQFPHPRYTHDHAICRMEEGRITHYLQLERYTRQKYDNRLPETIEELFERNLIPADGNEDWIFVNSFVGNCFISRSGRFRFECAPRSALTADCHPGSAWIHSAGWEGTPIPGSSMDHELAHVYSTLPFFGFFRENSLLIHFDGGASLSNYSAWHYSQGALRPLEAHWDLFPITNFFNHNALTFSLLNQSQSEHCSVPGKLMGFATMGTAKPEIQQWLKSNGFFKNIWTDKSAFYQKAKTDFGWTGALGDTRDPFLQNIAAAFQQIFEDDWIAYLSALQKRVRADYLYLSGGCALNIVANTRILNSRLFQDVFIPPCPGDSGLPIGAAAYLEWKKHGQIALHSPYLNNIGLVSGWSDFDPGLVRHAAQLVADGLILGICNGPGEAGPRALGNRSIIARPDSTALAQKVSVTCKGREWYRPIAPIMLEKNARRLTGSSAIHHLSRYMLLDYDIPPEHRSAIEGVVHANRTSRIQTLFTRADNPFMWDLLTCLDEQPGIPALINTSFNSRGRPIVHTLNDALDAAKTMRLDALIADFEFTALNPAASRVDLADPSKNNRPRRESTARSSPAPARRTQSRRPKSRP